VCGKILWKLIIGQRLKKPVSALTFVTKPTIFERNRLFDPLSPSPIVELLEFERQQIHDLARLHGLDWDEGQLGELISAIGGHPYLVRLAMYEISCGNIPLNQLLENSASESGIYSNHLRKHLEILQHNPELALALKKVVNSAEPVELNSMQIYKLHSMGIVRRQNNYVMPRCNLYREYFCRVLG
jgi:AAA-like domain